MTNKLAPLSLIINLVLIIAVVILFFAVYSDKGKSEEQEISFEAKNQNVPGLRIAFVVTDSVLVHYQLVDDLSQELEAETIKLDSDLTNKQKAFEKDASYFQQQVDNQTISNESAQAIYEQLMAKQQELYELEQRYMQNLSFMEMEMQETILDSLRAKLKILNANKQYDYILTYNAASNILIADDAYDITPSVIAKLNADYIEED